MGSGTIGAATEREHGIVGVMSYVCVHQCSACLAENFGLRQLQQLTTISRPLLFVVQRYQVKSAGLASKLSTEYQGLPA